MDRINAHKIIIILLALTIALIDCQKPLFADTRYVSDRLIISIREGLNKDDRILGYLKTDASVEVLEEKDVYFKIRTKDGLVGWVPKQYIVQEKPKARVIEDMRKEIMEINEKIRTSKDGQGLSPDELAAIKLNYEKQIKALEETIIRNQEITSAVKNQLSQTKEKYKNLADNSKKTDELLHQLDKLKKENAAVKTSPK